MTLHPHAVSCSRSGHATGTGVYDPMSLSQCCSAYELFHTSIFSSPRPSIEQTCIDTGSHYHCQLCRVAGSCRYHLCSGALGFHRSNAVRQFLSDVAAFLQEPIHDRLPRQVGIGPHCSVVGTLFLERFTKPKIKVNTSFRTAQLRKDTNRNLLIFASNSQRRHNRRPGAQR